MIWRCSVTLIFTPFSTDLLSVKLPMAEVLLRTICISLVVFIILDSLHSKSTASGTAGKNENSILSMNQVAYKMVDGRMDLQVDRYLDTFPFEYYVVLRNVEALPDVLSGTLKQFFERIAES